MTEGFSKKKKKKVNFYVQAYSNIFCISFLLYTIFSLILIPMLCWENNLFQIRDGSGKENKYFPRIVHNTGIKGNDIHTPSTSVSHWQNEFNEISPLPQRLVGRIN